jgi:translation initiation factor IF-1
MPNLRGGKGYKRGKGNKEEDVVFLTIDPSQMVGRIIRALGDLNMSVFCQDNITRICKIAVGIKKAVRFVPGDIVLLSLRDCLMSRHDREQNIRSNRGDIIGKFHETQFSSLIGKEEYKNVFINVETLIDITDKLEKGQQKEAEKLILNSNEENIFDYEGGKEEEEKEVVTKRVEWKIKRDLQEREIRDDEL